MVHQVGSLLAFVGMAVMSSYVVIKEVNLQKVLGFAILMSLAFVIYIAILRLTPTEPFRDVLAGRGIFWKVWLYYGYVIGLLVGGAWRVAIFVGHYLSKKRKQKKEQKKGTEVINLLDRR